jgi:hypothetical protein
MPRFHATLHFSNSPFRHSLQVVIRVVQPCTGVLRQASSPLHHPETAAPLTLAAALQNLYRFSLPEESGQVKPRMNHNVRFHA